ncbi:class II aldolase/adducin family protein [Georgenia subflava]|uniref:Aldolase n=1 Tax=Georgenia subflava TaxID=1622177 RepID=A0A6N7EHU8_9MICO|nr:class II aldolase/adducin family protein [Georgenia subflava]MPV36287.1 aldolase [Georgenia subflava]
MTAGDPDANAAELLCEAGRRVVDLGLSPGSSGNISVLVDGHILISATGTSLGALRPDDLSTIGLDGALGDGPKPSKEYPLHLEMYRRETSARAVVHLHSPAATAVSCLSPWSEHSALPPITPYLVMRVGQVPRVPYAAPGSRRLAENLATVPGELRAALLANHGSITSGRDLEAAIDAAIEIEEAARIVVALCGREVDLLSRQDVDELTARYGTVWDW